MKKHPDSQPCRAVPMDRGDNDNGYADEQFEGEGIYDEKPLGTLVLGLGSLVSGLWSLNFAPFAI